MKNTLIKFGAALYGPRYQRELAAALGVNERTMRRWVAGDYPPPEGVLADLRKLAAERVKELRALARLRK
jgi:hypothetical protein